MKSFRQLNVSPWVIFTTTSPSPLLPDTNYAFFVHQFQAPFATPIFSPSSYGNATLFRRLMLYHGFWRVRSHDNLILFGLVALFVRSKALDESILIFKPVSPWMSRQILKFRSTKIAFSLYPWFIDGEAYLLTEDRLKKMNRVSC